MTRPALVLVPLSVLSLACAAQEPVLGGPCEGCEGVFEGRPRTLASTARIAPVGEPGQPLVIRGTVRDLAGRSAPGTVVYAYHTDAKGIYPPASTRHGRLRGWAVADAKGEYTFHTIRPGAYPGGGAPEHVHIHVIEPGKGTYWIDDLVFDDDPLLTPAARRQMLRGRGGDGLGKPSKGANGAWQVLRDIVLGRNVPGYPAAR